MIDKDPSTYPYITYLWVMVMAYWGGMVGYIRKRRLGLIDRFSISVFMGELTTSGFAGIVTFFLCESAKVDPLISAAMIGIAGHMGSGAVFMFEKWLQKKFGDVKP